MPTKSVILELNIKIAMKNIYYYLLLGYFLSSYLSACSARATTTNITTDQSALLSLRAQITSDPHQFLENWSPTSSVCEWVGFVCRSRHRRVTAFNIANMSLTGTIPPQLGNQSFLVYLNMSRNNFHGELPHELSQLCRLQVLDFGVNDLGGELPSSIGSLHKLQCLSLRNNSFTGSIPPGISNMSNLEMLWLLYNSLEGTIPKEIGNLPNLKNLYMFYNQLSGPMPAEIFNISSLERVIVSSNRLTGGASDWDLSPTSEADMAWSIRRQAKWWKTINIVSMFKASSTQIVYQQLHCIHTQGNW